MGYQKIERFLDDRRSMLFKQPWTNPKHTRSQINGQTQQSQTDIKIAADSKKHFM
ncbi:YpzG family protein [Bacillus sp. RG28]|uniref:YpzG family protein n=1 Tax=Gottfriedia endophytica TaxID=2820819 RepID=A0A940NQV8_9BACI|nr:YpzG family protein [Gottfriedia endophytica]MBP0727191.1 YpzG family protein [Gottfriedia endophytica]